MSDPTPAERETENDAMSRLSDPMSSEYDEGPAQSGQQVRRSLDGKFVCPFCGSVNANTEEPCPKCGMENTPATRNSTRARIGPWYVLQKRNPSAPGMKFDTLLRFVQKGRVNARTIVRGPTTSQLWRFAATVKGLSREFGLCYNCGGDIDKTATLCPHCARNQQPPADPDSLLETKVPAPKNDVDNFGEELGGVDLSDATIAGEAARAAAPASPFNTASTVKPPAAAPKPKPEPAAENPVTAQMRREAQERKEIEEARLKREAQREADRRDPNKHVPTLNAAELATAFQLGIKPSAMGRPRHRRSHKKIWVFLTILLLIGAVVLVYFQVPAFQQFCNDTYAAAAAKVAGWTKKPDKTDPNVSKGVDAMTSKLPDKNVAKNEVKPIVPDVKSEPKPEPKVEIKPEPKPEPKIDIKPEPKPEPKVENPVIPVPPPVVTPPAPPKPRLSEDQAIEKVRTLWRQALTAEANGDWNAAVSAYEEIKTLQSSVWPAGLDLRLNDAKSHLRK